METEDIQSQLSEPGEALYRLISLAARDLRRGMHPHFREWGITGEQFGILLGGAEGANINTIAAQLLTDPTSAGRTVERMETAGLVQRYRMAPDRRVVWVRLTPAGSEILNRCLPLHIDRAREMLGCLSEDEHATLTSLLTRVRDYLAEGVSTATTAP